MTEEELFRAECAYVADQINGHANTLAQLSNETSLNQRWGTRRLIALDAAVTILHFVASYVRNLRML